MTKKEAIKVLRTESIELGGSAASVCRFWEALDMAVKALDAVPVVRCCQCKNGIVLQHSDFVVCHRGRMQKMDFCSYGKRKEGAD